MAQPASENSLSLSQSDFDILFALSLKGYRFLTCHHLSMLYFGSEDECQARMAKLCQTGIVSRLFVPTTDQKKQEAVYTLTRAGAQELARFQGINSLGLASFRKPSYLFLEHALRISDFMCSVEAALRRAGTCLLLWKSERQLKSPRGRPLRVPHPFELGEKIPVIPDGLFSLRIGNQDEHFFLEADRGTMSIFAMRNKMLGYVQLYRKRLYRDAFHIPHFRVLVVTSTLFRRERLCQALREIGYCQNMFWFAIWRDVCPEKILAKIWLKSRDPEPRSLLE
jgi:hypothetical protein